MALAYGDFHELSHQLRFLLFEAGIGLPQSSIDYFISSAHHECLRRLQNAVLKEGLVESPVSSHHVHDFIEQLALRLKNKQPASVFFQWQSLSEELEETIANEAMAQAYHQRWQTTLARQAKGYGNFWSWLCQENNPHEALQLLEQWGNPAHPYLPGFRAKMGFSRREVLQYSPEFNAQISLHWCALSQDCSQLFEQEQAYKGLLAEHFPEEYQRWQEKMAFKQRPAEAYYPIAVHPWQWRNHLQHQFSSLIDNKKLILLPHHQTVKPGMGPNLMRPLTKTSCSLKLSMTLGVPSEPQASLARQQQAPALSKWLNRLLENQHYYQQSFFVLKDLASLSIQGASIPAYQQKNLSLNLCENPNQGFTNNQRLVPLPALFAKSPLSAKPILIEIIEASGLDALAFFGRYCQRILTGPLDFLLRYGLSLAPEQQHSFIMFENNQPQALILATFNSLYLCESKACQARPALDFRLEGEQKTDSPAFLCQHFIQNYLQNNLARWVDCLSHFYSLEQKELWQKVQQKILECLTVRSLDLEPERLIQYRKQLLKAPWQYPALLTQRLEGKHRNETICQPGYNPLSACNPPA